MIQSQHHYSRYQRFIDSLRGQSVNGYFEAHHIVPRSMGGSDDADNMINLTARQHFVAHWMLARAMGGSAARAFFMMSNFGKYGQVNSTTYAIARQKYAEQVSQQLKGKPSQCKFSEETKQKMRDAKLGKKLTPEHIEKMRQTRIGKKMPLEFGKKVSQAKRGIATRGSGWSHSEETLVKMAASNRNRPMVTCPHCTKTVKDHGGAKRWHFDRCRFKLDITNGAELQDADGNVMTAEQVQAFMETLP